MLARQFVRAELTDLLIGRLRASAKPLLRADMLSLAIGTGLGVAVWSGDSEDSRHELPQLIITQAGQAESVLAWVITYSPAIRPFTAYCRVIDVIEFEAHLQAWRKPRLLGVDVASVGGIVGELLSTEAASERLARGDLTRAALQSSLLFVLLREAALYDTTARSRVLDAWVRVRSITHQPRRSLVPDDLSRIAAILRSLSMGKLVSEAPRNRLFGWCESVMLNKPILDSPISGFQDEFINGTREDRVVAFDRLSRDLALSRIPSEEGSFLLGYLASSILPGSMRYAPLLKPFIEQFKTAMIWLGICAGFRDGSELIQEFGGIGRRVLRDLLIPEELVDFPRSDIAAAELEVLLGGDRKVDDFMRTAASYLTVELIPGVQMSVSWQAKRAQVALETSVALPVADSLGISERAAMGRELENLRKHVEQVIRTLSGPTLPPEPQRELFEERPTRRSRKK